VKIKRLDVLSLLEALVASVGSSSFTDVKDSCLAPGVVKGAICAHPDEYLFWDGIHPTAAGHDYLSEKAKDALEKDLNTP
jgi:outer membrane lipase/esterase